ncbi:ThiJ/PfpI family protein [Talaromyces stipitatus ATCC 10500]|uniref:D-lactate dehydratase n=1 Tax=Talaromyces stipitatus (strain ATCC 10500 / CBS 375.48 / QM 6759 / NRRL 1006) TaxID=441959 RepID=B8MP98_TALSN|nr:ThiJ/PfpI family protein [Talaromyces stipitatus ATCC 10500]EED14337.1 ThiJ/PfpI family protein [Talaromyces stipitatus ATCC 10500]
MAPKKVLIVLSDAHSFPLKKPASSSNDKDQIVQQPSGFFLMELAKPLAQLLESGAPNPLQTPTVETLLAFAGNFYERRHENELIDRMRRENGFDSPRPFKSISDEELDSFAGVFIPGGHAPLQDLGDDPELGRILKHFHNKTKPTAAICHGPYAFLSTKATSPGEFAYKGYKLTSWSDAEERMMETMLGGEIEKVESSLKDSGAEMVAGAREKAGYITVDKEVVSGGNPLAADALGKQFLKMLSEKA